MARGKFKNTDIQAVYNRWIEQMVSQLANEGQKIIQEAYNTANDGDRDYDDYEYNAPNWKNVSGLLRESYGSAVYVFGKLRTDSIRFVGGFSVNTGDNDEIQSEDYITDFLKSSKTNSRDVITLMCVNAAPYAEDLEKGLTIKGNKYIVISQMADEMDAINKRIVMPSKFRKAIQKIGDFQE